MYIIALTILRISHFIILIIVIIHQLINNLKKKVYRIYYNYGLPVVTHIHSNHQHLRCNCTTDAHKYRRASN